MNLIGKPKRRSSRFCREGSEVNLLIEVALTNAILATLLVVPAQAVGRMVRRPALTHALWVLVLLKLITPPLLELPTGLHLNLSSVFPPTEEIALRSSLTIEPTHVHQIKFSTEEHLQTNSADQSNKLPISSDQTPENLVSSPRPNEDALSETSQESEFQAEAVSSIPMVEPALRHPATQAPGWFRYPAYLVPVLVFVWITGTLIWSVPPSNPTSGASPSCK